jgi:hypothetical protein
MILKDMNEMVFKLDKDSVTCGRTSESDVNFSESYRCERPGVLHWVSGRHFELERCGEDFFVRDLSRHGTQVKIPGKEYFLVGDVPYAISSEAIESGEVKIRAGPKGAYEVRVLPDFEVGGLN